MREIVIELDKTGRICGFPYHDGLLMGIQSTLSHSHYFLIKNSNNEYFQVLLIGVKQLVLNNYLEGNIINSINLWTSKDVPDVIIDTIINAMSIKNSENIRRYKMPNIKFIALESSYGAELYAIFEDIYIYKLQDSSEFPCKMQKVRE